MLSSEKVAVARVSLNSTRTVTKTPFQGNCKWHEGRDPISGVWGASETKKVDKIIAVCYYKNTVKEVSSVRLIIMRHDEI